MDTSEGPYLNRHIWGDADYDPPPVFEHGKFHPVAWLRNKMYNIVVYESRWPAAFFGIVVRSHDAPDQGFYISLGSGIQMGYLALRMAREIAGDMMGIMSLASFDELEIIDDGFGSSVSRWCPKCHGRTMQVVRPGSFQCPDCSGEPNENEGAI